MRILLALLFTIIANALIGQNQKDTISYVSKSKIDLNKTYQINVDWGLLKNVPVLDSVSKNLICNYFSELKAMDSIDSIYIYVYGRNREDESFNSALRKRDYLIESFKKCNTDLPFSIFAFNKYLKPEDYKPVDKNDPVNIIYISFVE